MFDVPVVIPVTIPVLAPIVATPGVPLVHVPPVAVLVSVDVPPAQILSVPAITSGVVFTVTIAVAIQPPVIV
jgi:hypothetical protein